MKTLATTVRPAALTLAFIVAAFLLPSQLTGQYELSSQKPVRLEYSTRNIINIPEIKPMQLSMLFSLARICLPFSTDQDELFYSGNLKPIAPKVFFCSGNTSADYLPTGILKSPTTPVGTRLAGVTDAMNVASEAAFFGPAEAMGSRILSSADWNKTMTEIEYEVENWMLNESSWMETSSETAEPVENWMLNAADWTDVVPEPLENIESWMLDATNWTEVVADPVENVESWMLNDLTWDLATSEVDQGVESWMNDDTTWASGDFSAEEEPSVEAWMLNTESWNVYLTAGIQ